VKASKVGLLFLILGFGATVETAWQVRNHLGVGPWDWQVLTGGKFSGPSFSFEDTESQVVPEGTPVEVENAFGGVHAVQGLPGEVKVVLRKVVFRRNEEEAGTFAGRIRLERKLEGGALKVGTNRREVEASQEGHRVGFETHLEITLPPGTRLKVQNEHGATEVFDVAEARVSGSYEAIRVERVAGATEVDSRHGDVTVADVKGALTLNARHGGVEVRQVKGHATLVVEHGDVTANEIGGLDLKLRHGGLTADGIMGDLEVSGEHAGVQAVAVTGRVVVDTAYQDVDVERVGGDVRLVSKHGKVRAADVTGAVYAESRYDDVELERIGGPVEVRVTHGGLQARNLEKGALVRTAGNDVVIDGFRGGLDIQAERGGVRLTPAGPLSAAMTVHVTHGGIELVVPEGSKFTLDASAANGEVVANVAGFTTTQTGPLRVMGTMGGGGSTVNLSAEGGNVELRSAAAVTSENSPR
jgi:putative adhesin